ncbi:uncharacterized protein FYW23_014016 isoform 2-T2 [Sylvia borin]
MEGFRIQLLAILTLLTQTCSASDNTEIRAVGETVTFRIDNTEGNGALWSVGDDPIVTVEFGNPPRPVFYQDEFKTRFTVSERGQALSITQLRMEDAGTYSVNINGKTSTFTLLVYRELTEPTMTCEAQDCSGTICHISLHCSVPGDGFGDISYTWRGWGEQWGGQSVEFKVKKSAWDNLELLMCTAWNAVSSRSVTVTNSGGLCPGATSSIGFGNGVIAEVIVGTGATAGVLLLFLGLFCKFRGNWPWRRVGNAAQLGFPPLLDEVIGTVSTPQVGQDLHQDWPQTSSDHHQDRPQTSSDHHQDWPQTSSDHHQDEPQTSSDHHQDWPQTSSDHHQDEPQTSSDHHQDWPRTSSDHHQDWPRTSSDHHQDWPWTSSDHHQDQSRTSSDHHEDQSRTSSDHHQDWPRTSSDHHQDWPWTSSDHHQDWPWTSSDHHQDQPWTSSDHHQDWPWTSSDHHQDWPRTCSDQCRHRPRTRSHQPWQQPRTNSDQHRRLT